MVPAPLARGRMAYQQRPLDHTTGVRHKATRLIALETPQCPHDPALMVDPEGDVENPVVRAKRGLPRKIKKPANTAGEVGSEARSVAQQLEEIIENDERLNEPTLDDVLADRQKHMSCTDWEKAQDADPAIKRMKELMEKFETKHQTRDS